jgi:hypothetical protein
MSYSTIDLINAIQSGKTLDCEKAFQSLVQEKLDAKLEQRTQEVRASMFESVQTNEAKKPVSKDDVVKLLVKHGNNPQVAKSMVDKEFDSAVKRHPDASASKLADIIRVVAESEEVEEAVRVMGSTSAGSSMTRMPKGMPGSKEHRDATAKMVKQVRASGQTLRKDSTTAVGSTTTGRFPEKRVMKYNSKDVQRESEE